MFGGVADGHGIHRLLSLYVEPFIGAAGNMKLIETRKEVIALGHDEHLPELGLRFGACRSYPDGNFCDIVDFRHRQIERWFTPPLDLRRTIGVLGEQVRPERFPGNPDFFMKEMASTHVLQVSPQGWLFINRGNFLNGTSFTMIDSKGDRAFIVTEEEDEEPFFYTATGGFSPDHRYWYFMRWPLSHSIAMMRGEATEADCEIGRVALDGGAVEIVAAIRNEDRIHQITPSPDGRYLVFTSFRSDMRVPYPRTTMEEDPEGYRASHAAGIVPRPVVTLDMRSGRHWRTQLPVPVSAHLEFDPRNPAVFYVSGHNFSINCRPDVIIEGPGAVLKLRIEDGRTVLDAIYNPGDLYRVSQHVPFQYQGKSLIAATNTPNKLDLIDAETMTLWRREELFPFEPLNFATTGSSVSPMPSKAFFSINPTDDGRFIVLESSESFHLYSVDEGRFLDVTVPRYLPLNAKGTGHTRLAGR